MKLKKKAKRDIKLAILWGWQYWDTTKSTDQIVSIVEDAKNWKP